MQHCISATVSTVGYKQINNIITITITTDIWRLLFSLPAASFPDFPENYLDAVKAIFRQTGACPDDQSTALKVLIAAQNWS